MVGTLSRDERPVLDIALRRVYELVGITSDPATHDGPPPTLAGLLEVLRATPGGGSIATRLERWAVGSLSLVFAGRAPSLRDRQLVVVGLASLTDPEVPGLAFDSPRISSSTDSSEAPAPKAILTRETIGAA
jgi:hypothetical protein